MQVKSAVVMLPVFLLQSLYQCAESAPFFRHDVGQQKSIQQPIAFRQMPSNADAARFLAADEYVFVEHQLAHMLEADAMLVELAPVAGCDPVQHFCRIKSTRDIARPLFAFE